MVVKTKISQSKRNELEAALINLRKTNPDEFKRVMALRDAEFKAAVLALPTAAEIETASAIQAVEQMAYAVAPDAGKPESAEVRDMRTVIACEGAAITTLEIDDRVLSIDGELVCDNCAYDVRTGPNAVCIVLGHDMKGFIVEFEVSQIIVRINYADMFNPAKYRKV